MDGLSGEYTITALSFCLKAGQLCYYMVWKLPVDFFLTVCF